MTIVLSVLILPVLIRNPLGIFLIFVTILGGPIPHIINSYIFADHLSIFYLFAIFCPLSFLIFSRTDKYFRFLLPIPVIAWTGISFIAVVLSFINTV